jgi:hypothetical protein
VPIRNQFGDQANPGPHLDDDACAELWASRADGATVRHPHLETCPECRESYAAFAGWLGALRDDARAEADEIFGPAHLAAERARIMDRLEALAPPGRVIAFPGQTQAPAGVRHHRQRWIAAAAAAGLFVGLAAGQMLHLTSPSPTQIAGSRLSPTPAAQAGPQSIIREASAPMDEALFYSDAAVTSPRVEALQALDALTPRVRDIDLPR